MHVCVSADVLDLLLISSSCVTPVSRPEHDWVVGSDPEARSTSCKQLSPDDALGNGTYERERRLLDLHSHLFEETSAG